MINVSSEFRQIMQTRRDFKEYATITLANKTVLNLEPKDFTVSNQSIVDGAGASALPLGEAVEKSIQIEIMNDKDQYSEYDFVGAKIKLFLKFQLSKTVETVNKGTYTVVTPETYGTVISITAVDDMYKADKTYDSSITYPTTVGEILRDACSKCGISLLTTTFANSTKQVASRPEEETTYRQIIGYCAMFAAGNARIDVNNYLSIIPYDFTAFEEFDGLDGGWFEEIVPYSSGGSADGGWFDENTPYSSGDSADGGLFDGNTPYSSGDSVDGGQYEEHIPYMSGDSADGGTFNPWNAGDNYDGGVYGDRKNVHLLYSFKNLTIDTDDVVVTGVQIEIEKEVDGKKKEIYISGKEGYMFAVENPLFKGIEKTMVDYLGSRLVGLRLRKFSGDHVSDPTIEAYDLALIVDRKNNTYQTIITDVDFTVLGWTTLSNSAESAMRNSSKYYSSLSKAVVAARKETEEQISDYDLAVQQLTSIMANSMGMFQTVEKTENGGQIVYQHNKPLLKDSDIVWKKSEAGFVVSTNGGKTWNAGIDAQGNAVVNVLSAKGVNAEWIKAGTITGMTIKGSTITGNTITGGTVSGATITGGSIKIFNNNTSKVSFFANTDMIGLGDNGDFLTYNSGDSFMTLSGELRVLSGRITGYRDGGKGIEINRTNISFYAWNDSSNVVGHIGSAKRITDNRVGIQMWCDQGDILWLGYSNGGTSILPFMYFDASTPENPPWIKGGASGSFLCANVREDGTFNNRIRVYVKNGIITGWEGA